MGTETSGENASEQANSGDVQDRIEYGEFVHCLDGLGRVQEVKDGMVKCYIQSFGCRWFRIEDVRRISKKD